MWTTKVIGIKTDIYGAKSEELGGGDNVTWFWKAPQNSLILIYF